MKGHLLGTSELQPTSVIDQNFSMSCAVFDNVRSNVPHMLLDDVFTAKEEIASSVKLELVRLLEAGSHSFVLHFPCARSTAKSPVN